MKRLISVMLTLCMLVSMLPMATLAAEQVPAGTPGSSTAGVNFEKFTDVRGHWGEKYLRWAVQNGLMVGISTTKVAPDSKITRAQVATMVARAFGATKMADTSMYVDIKSTDWFYDSIAEALQMGCLETFGNAINPNEAVTRQEVAVMLVKAAGYPIVENPSAVLARFSDSGQTSQAYRDYFATAIANGLIGGYGDGRCGPTDNITRAQFATIMHSIASAYMTKTITYSSKTVEGSLMVGLGGIKLNNMAITKNLFLTDGVDAQSIVIDGTTVGGTVFVRGTGGEGLHIVNGSKVGAIVFTNPNNAVKVTIDESSSVGNVYVQNGKDSVTVQGDIGNLYVNTGKVPVILSGSSVKNAYLNAKLCQLKEDKDSSIDKVYLESTAGGATLEADGKVGTLSLNAANSNVTINGALTALSFGKEATGTKFKIGKNANLKTVELSSDKMDLDLNGKMTTVDITSNDSQFGFESDFEGTTINLDGDDDELTLVSGATVKNIFVNGDDIDLNGKGTVTGKITIESGKRIDISIPGAVVYNKGGSEVYVGDIYVRKGETVTVNASGTGTVEDDIANGRDPNAGGSTNNGSSSGSANGGKGWVITLVPNGGTVSSRSYRTDASGAVPLLPTPTRSGYKFIAWFTSATGGNIITQGSVIANNTTLYAHWEADSTKPGNNNDPSNPTNPPAVTPVMTLFLPVEGQPSDFGYESSYSYASFGTGLALNQVDTGYELTGTVKEIKGFKWYNENDGYFVPVVLQTTVVNPIGTVKAGDTDFVAGNLISTGTGYGGQIIAYLKLAPLATEKKVTITYDPDGSSTSFNPVSATIDYSNVQFIGDEADDAIYDAMVAMPGVDGGETAVLDKTKVADCEYTVRLSTSNLLETKNDGRYGYWVGIRIPAYSDVGSARIRVTDPTGVAAEASSYYLKTSESGDKYIEWVIDASRKSVGSGNTKGIYQLEISWYDAAGEVTAHKAGKVTVNLTGCILAGEAGSTNPIPADAKDCVTNLKYEVMTAEEVTTQFSRDIAEFGINLAISNDAVRGQLFPVKVDGSSEYAYYLPVKITGRAADDATGELKVTRDAGGSISAKEISTDAANNFTIYALLEMIDIGSTVSDTKVTIALNPAQDGFKNVETVLSCDSVQCTRGHLVVSADVPTGTVAGQSVNSVIEASSSGASYRVFFNNLNVNDGVKVKKLSNVTIYGKQYTEVWVLPVSLRVIGDGNFRVVCGSDSVNPFWSLSSDQFTNGTVDVLVPVAVGGTSYSIMPLSLYFDGSTDVAGTVNVYAYQSQLEGFTGDSSGTPVLPDPQAGKTLKSITIIQQPTVTEYKVGETLSTEGMSVEATFESTDSSGVVSTTKEDVTSQVKVQIGGKDIVAFTEDQISDSLEVTVIYSYEPESGTPTTRDATFTVKVTASEEAEPTKVLKSIAVDISGVKTEYNDGDALDLTGLVVTATYTVGEGADAKDKDETVSTGWVASPVAGTELKFSGSEGDASSTTEVTISLGEGAAAKTTTFNVTIKAPEEEDPNPAPTKTLQSISVKVGPTTTEYADGATLDLEGLVIEATYSDNSTAEIEPTSVDPADGSTLTYSGDAGKCEVTITVTYSEGDVEKTVTFTVSVLPPEGGDAGTEDPDDSENTGG